jgi:starch synthase (maltosyl-transferring)
VRPGRQGHSEQRKQLVNVEEGRLRVIIEGVSPEIDAGRFPIKRTLGDEVEVEADIFADGHDVISAVLKHRRSEDEAWSETAMEPLVNDRWRGSFPVTALGVYLYTIEAWVDHFRTWRRDLQKKFKAGLDVTVELMAGVGFCEAAARRAAGQSAEDLTTAANSLRADSHLPTSAKLTIALSPRIAELVEISSERLHPVLYERELRVWVDPVLARFGAWYEAFPRSMSPDPNRSGTLKDCEAFLPRVAELGFDVLYLPPIHPIGRSFRKGRNNSLTPEPGDPGSPWAIGSEEGGHKAVHRELGTIEDFRHLVQRARELQIEIALDIAFQCSPDHPWVTEHPEWFRKRPDGSIQYAENPPKKYQDIYPIYFETENWRELWIELKSVFEFWIEQGVRLFRVDNPHTKSFRYWEWCLNELKQAQPDLIFLSEAFTRPKVMYHLAKLGYTQSYNYFPWRNTKHELIQYFTELTRTEVREYFRASLWPNTPDILTQYLQYGGRPAFMTRLVLAATLGATYGIYGPPFEACENRPREPGSEEYLDSEKYELRRWDFDAPESLGRLMGKVNAIRRENAALHTDFNLEFHEVDNEHLIAYSKKTEDLGNVIITIVNLDPHHTQRGWVRLPLEQWGFGLHDVYQLHELLTGAHYLWTGQTNYVELNPQFVPAHVFRLRRYVRTEQDFDYFL